MHCIDCVSVYYKIKLRMLSRPDLEYLLWKKKHVSFCFENQKGFGPFMKTGLWFDFKKFSTGAKFTAAFSPCSVSVMTTGGCWSNIKRPQFRVLFHHKICYCPTKIYESLYVPLWVTSSSSSSHVRSFGGWGFANLMPIVWFWGTDGGTKNPPCNS